MIDSVNLKCKIDAGKIGGRPSRSLLANATHQFWSDRHRTNGGTLHNLMKEADMKHNLTGDELKELVSSLLARSVLEDGTRKLRQGAIAECAGLANVSTRTAYRVWTRALASFQERGVFSASPRRKGRCGRKPVYDAAEIGRQVAAISAHERGTLRSTANALGVSVGYLHKQKVAGEIQATTNTPRPYLREDNKLMRMYYCIDRLQRKDDSRSLVFVDSLHEIHVDEKWFYLSQVKRRYYISPDEKSMYRTVAHKSHIKKVMFLAAVARPRFGGDDGNECLFDGKIGIWPFVEEVAAKRTSVNRPRGTLENKPVSVTRDVYRRMVIDNLLPAIRARWPVDLDIDENNPEGCTVVVQQDNAPSHISPNDPEWVAAAAATEEEPISISMTEQPANSPDLNVLDLGFFRALQSSTLQRKSSTTIDDFIATVKSCFWAYDPRLLNRVWLTHQLVMQEILLDRGGNDYDLPHYGKARKEREGTLPAAIELSNVAKAVVAEFENTEGV